MNTWWYHLYTFTHNLSSSPRQNFPQNAFVFISFLARVSRDSLLSPHPYYPLRRNLTKTSCFFHAKTTHPAGIPPLFSAGVFSLQR